MGWGLQNLTFFKNLSFKKKFFFGVGEIPGNGGWGGEKNLTFFFNFCFKYLWVRVRWGLGMKFFFFLMVIEWDVGDR